MTVARKVVLPVAAVVPEKRAELAVAVWQARPAVVDEQAAALKAWVVVPVF